MDHVHTLAREFACDTIDVATSTPRPVEQATLPDMPPATPLPGSPTVTPSPVIASAKPRFAGFTYPQLFAGLLILAATIWGMWATSKIFALEDRRVVSVRLAAIVNDFVSAEARSGTPPEQLAVRTKAFITALDGVLKARAARGQVVLVGEAVVASSVPDVTSEVAADLAKIVPLGAPAAMLPATRLPPPSPQSSAPPAAPSPASPAPQASDAPTNPFELPPQPAQTAPQQ